MKVVLLANWGLGLEILKILHSLSDIDICMVVTRFNQNSADKWENAVYEFSCKQGYRTINQENISFDMLKDWIVQSETDILITHAFMRILPNNVLILPKHGTINIHPSLLPKYRGPSPTFWVLRNREKSTGLTCHYMDEGIDTGDIIYQTDIPVKPDDTVGSVIERQKTVIKELITESLSRITDSRFQPIPQISEHATYAPRPEKTDFR
ncbi:MAG: hypothetical protein GY795_38110 [Desulfobacterales bacterium]|nr:hypothetical protein [Desulfobacterales bacterium]